MSIDCRELPKIKEEMNDRIYNFLKTEFSQFEEKTGLRVNSVEVRFEKILVIGDRNPKYFLSDVVSNIQV